MASFTVKFGNYQIKGDECYTCIDMYIGIWQTKMQW